MAVEQDMRNMVMAFKDLAYTRRALLLRIMDISYNSQIKPEEKIEIICDALRISGFTPREETIEK